MNMLKYKIELYVNDAIRSANQFMASLRVGLTIDFGRRLVDGFLGIKRGIEGAIKEGVRFNATVESSVIGIAAVMRQFSSDKFATFGEAMRGAADAVEYLKKRAKETPATFESLVMSFQSLSGPMSAAGIEIKKQIDLVVIMSQALAGLGIREEQLIQESRALVTGMINQNAAAAKILNITKEQIDAARQSGQLYEFLTGKLSAFNEAASVGASSFATAASNLKDSMQQAFGAATRALFDQLKASIQQLSQALESGEIKTGLQMIAGVVGSIIGGLSRLAGMVARNSVAFAGLVTVFGALATASAAIKLGKLVVGMIASTAAVGSNIAAHLRRITTLNAETGAMVAHTAATNANTAAMAANNAAAIKPVTSLNRPKFGSGNAAVLTGRSTAQAAGQMTTVSHTAASANAAAADGAAARSGGAGMAAAFGSALANLAIWGTIAYIIGSALAKMLDEWSRGKTSAAVEGMNARMASLKEQGNAIGRITSEHERSKAFSSTLEKRSEASKRLAQLQDKTFKSSYDKTEIASLQSDIEALDKFIGYINSLTKEQIEAQKKRVEAEQAAAEAAKKSAQEQKNAAENEEPFIAAQKQIGQDQVAADWQLKLASADTPKKRIALLKEESRKVNEQLREKGDLGAAKSAMSPDEFKKRSEEVVDLNKRSVDLNAMLLDAKKDNDAEINQRREENKDRLFERKWDRATDEQKAGWLAKELASAKKELAGEQDPLKREAIRGRMLDLAERGDQVEKSRAARRESLADQARRAGEGLAGMGLARQAGGDLGIGQRFDWLAQSRTGKSPDEQIAANTEEMKNYLKAIAEAEGVK